MKSDIFLFEKGEKVASVPFEVLKETVQLKQAGTNHPGPTRPLQSWELILAIQEYLEEAKKDYILDDIYVQKRSSHRILTKEEESMYNESNTPANKWMFDHVITRFNMGERGGLNPSIGISFNKKGIHVVWGTNVIVCQNMCVFGDNMISTYGISKVPFSKQMELLKYWIERMEVKFNEDAVIIENMQNKAIDETVIKNTLGELYTRAITQAYYPTKGIIAPLNTGVLSQMTQNIVEKGFEKVETVWDLYNTGTEVIKVNNFNIEDVFPTNISWGNYLISEFELN